MKNNLVLIGLVVFGIILRLLPHAANFTPVGAITLFAFSYFPFKKASIIPLAIMMVTDLFLGHHPTMIWVYSSLVLAGLMLRLHKNRSWTNIVVHSIAASFVFYIITNFGVWISTSMYEKSLIGLIDSYYMAIPFFRNSLLADLSYGTLLFGIYNYRFFINEFFSKRILRNQGFLRN